MFFSSRLESGATPGVLMLPLESEFGLTSAAISAAIAINLTLFGLIGPFAALLMDRWGLRRLVLCALTLLTVSVGLTTLMKSPMAVRPFVGSCVGSGTGVTAMVLAAVVANRWFDRQRGLVLGGLTAANATGQLLFLPVLARPLEHSDWRSVRLLVASSAAVVFFSSLLLCATGPLRWAFSHMSTWRAMSLCKPNQRHHYGRSNHYGTLPARLHSGYWRVVSSSAEQAQTAW